MSFLFVHNFIMSPVCVLSVRALQSVVSEGPLSLSLIHVYSVPLVTSGSWLLSRLWSVHDAWILTLLPSTSA